MKRFETLSGTMYRMKELKKAVRFGECAVALRAALPDRYLGEVEPVEVRRDLFVCRVENPVFLEELGLLRRELLAAVNDRLDLPLSDLVFRLGSVDRATALSEDRRGEPPLPDGTAEACARAAACAGDPDIAASLERLFVSLARRGERLRAEGFAPCPACGRLADPGAPCRPCARAAERETARAMRFFRLRPWAGAEEFRAVGGFAPSLYPLAKSRLAARLRARIEAAAEEGDAPAERRARRGDLALYLSLAEGRPVPEPDPELVHRHFDRAVAERLLAPAPVPDGE